MRDRSPVNCNLRPFLRLCYAAHFPTDPGPTHHAPFVVPPVLYGGAVLQRAGSANAMLACRGWYQYLYVGMIAQEFRSASPGKNVYSAPASVSRTPNALNPASDQSDRRLRRWLNMKRTGFFESVPRRPAVFRNAAARRCFQGIGMTLVMKVGGAPAIGSHLLWSFASALPGACSRADLGGEQRRRSTAVKARGALGRGAKTLLECGCVRCSRVRGWARWPGDRGSGLAASRTDHHPCWRPAPGRRFSVEVPFGHMDRAGTRGSLLIGAAVQTLYSRKFDSQIQFPATSARHCVAFSQDREVAADMVRQMVRCCRCRWPGRRPTSRRGLGTNVAGILGRHRNRVGSARRCAILVALAAADNHSEMAVEMFCTEERRWRCRGRKSPGGEGAGIAGRKHEIFGGSSLTASSAVARNSYADPTPAGPAEKKKT